MYLPGHFEETRTDVLQAFVAAHPFGLWVTAGASGLLANAIPFLLDAGGAAGLGVLRGHVARANPAWREAGTGESLVVFQGPQAYVSPGWYPSKAAHGKVVPTWNYLMVQARGRVRAIEHRDWLRGLVSRLTDRHEATRAEPWAVGDAPEAYVTSMLDAIVGIEIEVEALVGKWKLSQNRSAADRAGVIDGLHGLPRGTAGDAGEPGDRVLTLAAPEADRRRALAEAMAQVPPPPAPGGTSR